VTKSERIQLLLEGGGEWSAYKIASVLRLWSSPYADLHRMEREGKIESRWLDMPYPRRRVYFAKGRANAENIRNS
jgi:DNA-binding PadR family transcriptional regulator